MESSRLIYLAWAVVTLAVWATVFRLDLLARKRGLEIGEVLTDGALFMTSLASAVSLIVLVVGQDIPGLRGFCVALALGGFTGAGIVRLSVVRKRRA